MDVNKESVNLVADYVRASEKYTFRKFFEDHDMMEDSLMRYEDLVVKCFGHTDNTASLSTNDSRGIFNCFACEMEGGYVDLLVEYSNKVLGEPTNFFFMLNKLLVDDKEMQFKLGISTIFLQENLFSLDFNEVPRIKVKKSLVPMTSYLELADIIKKKFNHVEVIKMFILMMQEGVPAHEIHQNILDFGNTISKPKETNISIMDLFSEED